MLYNAFATMGEAPMLRLYAGGFAHKGRFYEIQASPAPDDPMLLCVRVSKVSSPGRVQGLDAREKTQRLLQLKRTQDTTRLARRVHHARSKKREKALQSTLAARTSRSEAEQHMFTFYLRLPGWRARTESEYQQCYGVVWKWMICGMIRHLPKHKTYLEGLRHAQLAFKGSWCQPWVNARAFAPSLAGFTRDHLILTIPSSDLPDIVPMRQPMGALFASTVWDIRGAQVPYDLRQEQLAQIRSSMADFGPSLMNSFVRVYRQGQQVEHIWRSLEGEHVQEHDSEEE